MKDILKQALKKCDQAEIVVFDTVTDTYSHYGSLANEVLSKRQAEICLRIIKDGRVGISNGSYKVDTEAQQELAGTFGIQSIPSILFIPMEGAPKMSQGALPKDSFVQIITDEFKVS